MMKNYYFYKYAKIMNLNQGCMFLTYCGETILLGYVKSKDWITEYGKGVYVYKDLIKEGFRPKELYKKHRERVTK